MVLVSQPREPALAFHGILPRGAIEQASELGLERAGWPWMGAFLELALAEGAPGANAVEDGLRKLEARLGGLPPTLDREGADRWLKAAGRIGLVPYLEGARLAEAALRRWGSAQPKAWCVKEGHTASVWCVPPGSVPGAPGLAVLVPRDRVAERELVETSDELRRLHGILPDRVAREWCRELLVRDDGSECSIVAMEWLAGSKELHVVGRGNRDAGRLIPVERFHPPSPGGGSAGQVAHISRKTPSSEKLWHDLVCLWTCLTFASPDENLRLSSDPVMLPGFEINDGDFVLAAGTVKVVACSRPARVSARDAISSLLAADAVDDGPAGWARIAGGSRGSTWAAIQSGLASCLSPEFVHRLAGGLDAVDAASRLRSRDAASEVARTAMTS